jgi:GNAT superfamily N-acetyltransferase
VTHPQEVADVSRMPEKTWTQYRLIGTIDLAARTQTLHFIRKWSVEMAYFNIRYNFIRSRQLEGTYPGDPKEGVWGITAHRVSFGWGTIKEFEWPSGKADSNNFLDPEPRGLDQSAKRYRIHHYERIRNSTDVRVILDINKNSLSRLKRDGTNPRAAQSFWIQLAFEVTREFVNAPRGLIALPSPESPVLGTHSVALLDYSHSQGWFEFNNTWGSGWGNNGQGYMPLVFVDEWMTESWAVDVSAATFPECSGIQELHWDVRDPLGDCLYGLEIFDGKSDERLGWSFIVHRGGYLDIEELYVRPDYRGRGFGGRLVGMILDLAREHRHTLRAWIPFVDCQEANRPALARTILKLGLNIRRSGVPWAAYVALPSKRKTITFDNIHIPQTPAYSKSANRQPDDGTPPFVGQGGELSYEGGLSDDALSEIAESLFRALDAEEAEHAER